MSFQRARMLMPFSPTPTLSLLCFPFSKKLFLNDAAGAAAAADDDRDLLHTSMIQTKLPDDCNTS